MVFQTDLELEVPPDLDDNNCMMNENCKVERCYNRRNTSLVGYLESSWDEIDEMFGPIAEECRQYQSCDKSYNDWWLLINGEPVFIYDYKESRSYLSSEKIMFHVGGKSIQALFELMCVGFKPEQVLTQSDFRDRVFAKFSA